MGCLRGGRQVQAGTSLNIEDIALKCTCINAAISKENPILHFKIFESNWIFFWKVSDGFNTDLEEYYYTKWTTLLPFYSRMVTLSSQRFHSVFSFHLKVFDLNDYIPFISTCSLGTLLKALYHYLSNTLTLDCRHLHGRDGKNASSN